MSQGSDAPGSSDVIDIARELIRTPSPNPPGDERDVAESLRRILRRLGLPEPRVVARDEQRPNLVVTLEFGPGGSHLALCGHIDTKPVGDAHWSVDPFDEPLHGDQLYGLGSGDMKAGVAAMLVAAARLGQDPPEHGRLTLLLTADEEDGAYYGAQLVAASADLDVDGIVIGEPGGIEEDFDRLHLVSRGIARLRLVARARQGHSSLSGAAGTRNAGVDAARLVVAVDRDVAMHVPDDPDGLAGWEATVNTGMLFEGGVGFGVLPGRIAVGTEVRLLPGMTRDRVVDAFRAVLNTCVEETGADLSMEFDAEPNDWLPAAQVSVESPLAQAAQRACEQVFGRSLTPSVFPGTTDATWFDHLRGIPTLPALGPGLLSRAHAADEWVSVAAVRQAVDLYVAVSRDFCSLPSGPSGPSASPASSEHR